MPAPITREMAGVRPEYEWLRFQTGHWTSRYEQEPLFIGKRIVGYRDGNATLSVFHLMGFGSTAAQAEAMAKRNASPFAETPNSNK